MHVWILADVPSNLPGGMRRHMELHAEGLKRLGHRATLWWADSFPACFPAAVTRRLPGWRSVSALLRDYRRQRPDVINVHTACAPAWIAACAAGLVTAKIVAMSYAGPDSAVRVSEPVDILRWILNVAPSRLSFRWLDGVWCVNQQDLELYLERYGIARDRLRRIGHAIDDGFFAAPRLRLRRPRQVLFAGTWIRRKGVDVLAPALERVVEVLPDVEIVLAGTLSGESMVRASLSPQVAARTRVLDQVGDADMATLYRTSTLLLLPSRLEGLPISMLEAMACGCPPLAAANSGMLDVVDSGRNGWLEVSFDPARWAERIVDLLSRPDDLDRASQGAQATAAAFRIERVTAHAVAFYQDLIDRGSATCL